MPHHSIIIPHRNRWRRLRQCLRSLAESARVTGVQDYEALIVDQCSGDSGTALAGVDVKARLVSVSPPTDGGFNKCRLLNAGIELSDGEVLSFLDADAIIGPRWLEGVGAILESQRLTRLCYRVRELPETILDEMEAAAAWRDVYRRVFNCYDSGGWAKKYEAYTAPEYGVWEEANLPDNVGPHVFGNSQFSIRRDVLGDLRYDADKYPQASYEDLDFIRRIARRYGKHYRAMILRNAAHAMFHIKSERELDWHDKEQAARQKERYLAESKQ